jgi:hypothetical protein
MAIKRYQEDYTKAKPLIEQKRQKTEEYLYNSAQGKSLNKKTKKRLKEELKDPRSMRLNCLHMHRDFYSNKIIETLKKKSVSRELKECSFSPRLERQSV